MAATSILSTDDEMNAMAGENVDLTGFTDANKTAWGIQAEGFLCMLTNYDLVTNVETLGAKFLFILNEYVARYVAVSAISYNMEGFTTRIEAEDMINIHLFRMKRIEKILTNGESLTNLGVS